MGLGKILLLSLLFSTTAAWGGPLGDWMLNPVPGDDESEATYTLAHKDGRPAISIQAHIAEQIQSGATTAEQVYLSRTKNSALRDGQVLGNSGLVAPNDPIYSTAVKDDQPASHNESRSPSSLMGVGSSSVGSSHSSAAVGSSANRSYAPPASASAFGTASSSNGGGYNGSNASSAAGSSSAATTAQQGAANTTNQGLNTATTGGNTSAQTAAEKTANAYYQQYFGGNTGAYIPYDTNSGQYDPNIAAGSNASLNEIKRRAGKYAR